MRTGILTDGQWWLLRLLNAGPVRAQLLSPGWMHCHLPD